MKEFFAFGIFCRSGKNNAFSPIMPEKARRAELHVSGPVRLTPHAPTASASHGDPAWELRRGPQEIGGESLARTQHPLHCSWPGITPGWTVAAAVPSARDRAPRPPLWPELTAAQRYSHQPRAIAQKATADEGKVSMDCVCGVWCHCGGGRAQANGPGAGLGTYPHTRELCNCTPANFSQ